MYKSERLTKKYEFIERYDNFDEVFTFENLYNSYKECIKKVSWKSSVQRYIADDISNLVNLQISLRNGKFRSRGFYEFDIIERGKPRHIKSVDIEERIVQRCLCDYCLIPVLTRGFIFDNSACIPGKGQHFAINRIRRHIKEYYNKYGCEGYVLTTDFKNYFENIRHDIIYNLIDNTFNDPRILRLVHHFVDAFGEIGLGLGSQISQILAVAVSNPLDHYIKEVLKIRWYGRYNDDMWFICKTKKEAALVADKVKSFSECYGFLIHPNKIKINHLKKGFKFMKIKFILKHTGYIVMLPDTKKVVQERRKLKKIRRKIDLGILSNKDGFLCWQGWNTNISICNSYKQRKEIKELSMNLFGTEEFNKIKINRKLKNRR